MAKKKFKLMINIGKVDADNYGLTEDGYSLADLTEGKEIELDDKLVVKGRNAVAIFIENGWVETPGGPATAAAAPAPGEEEDSPVSDTNADEAIEAISRMRSKDRLQHIIDNDKRATVVAAARKRIVEANK